ncbi:MAG: hypothetical protein JWO98_180 [Frankiales bacterium]|nr:hypothetical protein [Frankiales bacterium]
MSIWGRAKATFDELLGRAEELYGESHGDPAAEVHGEALRLEGEAEESEEREESGDRRRRPGDGTAAG